MDTELLVEDRKTDGRKLLNLLAERNFDVAAACWIKSGEDDRWHLYIVSPVVDESGKAAAIGVVLGQLRSIPGASISLFEVKVIGTANPIARQLVELVQLYPGRFVPEFHRPYIGFLSAEEIYVYPPPESLRQSFSVTYRRQGKTTLWRAKIEPGELYRRVYAKGAVGYSTGHWEGEGPEDEDSATVRVLLEVDPRFDDKDQSSDPGVWKVLTDQARMTADDKFLSRHPGATIEHVDASS